MPTWKRREAVPQWGIRRRRKRLEFVSAKRASSALQAREATIERTVSNPPVCPLRQRMPVPMDRHFDYVSHITRRPRTVPCILQGYEQGRKRFSFPSSLNISDHFQPFVHNAQIFLSPFRLRPFSRVSQSIPDFSRDYVDMKMRE